MLSKASSDNNQLNRESFSPKGTPKQNLQLATIAPHVPVTIATVPSITSQTNEDEAHNIYSTESKDNSNSCAIEAVDFIGPSKAVRNLFSLPYSTDRNVSVALHTIGNGTILLDSGDETGEASQFMFGSEDVRQPTNHRPGRRRRQRSWSTDQQQLTTTKSRETEEQTRLAEREGEKSLLASLSLLLEEERKMENSRKDDSVAVVKDAFDRGAESTVILTNKEADLKSSTIVSSNNPIGQTMQSMRSDSDPKDKLADKLQHPNHYLRHVVSPPSEPNQYLHWNFKGMNMLVASDANVYTQQEMGDDENNNSPKDSSRSIVLKVADASDLRSQMEHHQCMVNAGTITPSFDDTRQALPPSSYAEALLKEKSDLVKDAVDTTKFDNVKLQTCIIPSFNVGSEFAEFGFSISPSPSTGNLNTQNNDTDVVNSVIDPNMDMNQVPYSSTPYCTVLDTYLDNIMANVPQLALILREHGFISNIKLMQTEDIPSLLMHPSTLNDSTKKPDSLPEPIFSPEIVEMNAAMLLRFLKTNCTKENSTYLLHRSAGEANLQLFDISSISQLRQRKWIWWLALCSYRFACRLEQLQNTVLAPSEKATKREYRKRQRSLLHNTLDLLQELADMDGGRHETVVAAVYDHLAETYLWNDEADGDVGLRDTRKPVPLASTSHPYNKVSVDSLNKAHDHLLNAIEILKPLLAKAKHDGSIELEAITKQLYGMHHKLVNICLRLANNHLQSYFSSNLIQSLRSAARMLSDATFLLMPLNLLGLDKLDVAYTESILCQYSWLWEYCGHFARSFAADELWRERGHTCGNDLLSLFREVDSACCSVLRHCLGPDYKAVLSIVGAASHGQVSLKSLTGIVVLPDEFEQVERSVLQKEGCHEAINNAKSIVYQKSQIKRDECLVLVAATLCYSNAIAAQRLATTSFESESAPNLLFQRLGDACNEIGQILLKTSRQVLTDSSCNTEVTSNAIEKSYLSAIFLASANFWFLISLQQFNIGKDLRNVALIRCNLSQVCKIRANTNVVLPGSSHDVQHESEQYLQQAVDHLVLAHEKLGQRETDAKTWDMVSEELAATLLVLGVRRRQSSVAGAPKSSDPLTMTAFRPAPGVENSIVEPMIRACNIYESLGTHRSAQQAAAAHYQLAMYFSKVWTIQRDEAKTREKLAAAFNHFGAAHNYYSYNSMGNEATFVCVSLDFSNLYSAVSDREDCLTKALAICLNCSKAFAPGSISLMRAKPTAKEWFFQMTTLSNSIHDRLSKLLLALVKFEMGRAGEDKYKNMYRQVLSFKRMQSNRESSNEILPESFAITDLFEALTQSMTNEVAKD